MKKVFHAFFMCLGMFCAIPCPYRPWDEEARGLMTACLPLVGLLIGLIWYILAFLGQQFLPNPLLAVWVASLPYLLTGFMHLDGYMDTVDAILSWRPVEERQKILKDVHCGSFAVVCLVLLLLGMYAACCEAVTHDLRPLILIPVVSRCMSSIAVSCIPTIGHSEYTGMRSSLAGPMSSACILLIACTVSVFWLGCRSLFSLFSVCLAYSLAMTGAVRSLKGVSGDLAGYALSIGELAGVVLLAIL